MSMRTPRSILMALLLATSLSGLVSVPAWSNEDEGLPFRITVDGQDVTGSEMPAAREQTGVQIDVKFDGLGVSPMLNVSTVPPRASYKAGDQVDFLASLNYAAWIAKGEIRIFKRGIDNDQGLLAVLPISQMATASWIMPGDGPAEFDYVLRVYDAQGRYDETIPRGLSRTASDLPSHDFAERATAPGAAEDHTAFRNIEVIGGVMTVYGKRVPEGHNVVVMGEPIPVDADGSFVVQRIMPQGNHEVDIKVEKDGQGLDFSRTITIPESEWFYMGLADATLGYNFNDHVENLRPGDFANGAYTRGRLAFYLKGKIKGRYILTAAADTGDKSIKDMFKGLDGKDPQSYLKRIDPDDYYPVYGDDSTSVEDAPTKGKFYVRLEKGPSHVMWGNFKSNITGTKFLHNERSLYGAQAVYRSSSAAPDGGARTAVDLHAAMPGTVPGRDVFRGTGGSAYFVKHQDVTAGSESVSIEVRNAVTGWVVQRHALSYGTDYDFDYVQGLVILKSPLSSSDTAGTENYLVATYEYVPVARDVDGYVAGGRAQQWLGDHLRVGVTAERENTDSADQTMYGADAHLRYSDGTWLEGEVARTEGPGFGSSYSADGGLTLQDNASAGIANKTANAYRVESRIALEDLSASLKGHVGAHYEYQQGGFSTLDVNTSDTRHLSGADADVQVNDSLSFSGDVSDEHVDTGKVTTEAHAKADVKLTDKLTVEPYGSYVRKTGSTSSTAEQGRRGDAGVKILYAWNEDTEAFVFGQGTFAQTGTMKRDDRAGVGGTFRFSEKITGEGEISGGSQGAGVKTRLAYEPTADDKYYVGYTLDPARDESAGLPYTLVGDDLGTIVAGARHRFNDKVMAYAEDNYDIFGERRTLAQIYGVTYTPADEWSISAASEIGTVIDNTINSTTHLKNPDLDRLAFSATVDYKSDNGIDGRLKGEWRRDDSEDNMKDVEAYLLQGRLGVQMSEDWRALASFDGVFTSATDTTRDGDYAEGSLGFAYRPAKGDRFNMLGKYTFLYDLPGKDQVSVDGTTSSPAQRSHIINVDASYDLTPQLTIGGKYGFRIGQTKDRAPGSEWQSSQVHLGVLRADLHVVHEWDALLEGRVLWSPTTEQRDFGAVAAIYRHFSDNMKVGFGYNFGRFSDDLRDLSQNDHGVFLNVIGEF
jgi:hypothetical protein